MTDTTADTLGPAIDDTAGQATVPRDNSSDTLRARIVSDPSQPFDRLRVFDPDGNVVSEILLPPDAGTTDDPDVWETKAETRA